MSKSRKQYTEEFKLEALQLWEISDKSAAEIENNLGISHGMLYHWKGVFKKKAQTEIDGSRAEAAEMRRLRKELALVKQERDILKKAVSIFSRPNQ